ncbi:MAG TPA: DUF5309 family protein [Phycisphaerae bacterium]|nr:DUF5309 family protein [Phycisphaerae bacterium]
MSFSGKATYAAGSGLPEIVEDVSDVVSIVSPHETALLDALGDPLHAATNTRHEWLEDELISNVGQISQSGLSDTGANTTSFTVADGSLFRAGDLLQGANKTEVMMVTGVSTNTLTVTRGYGGTTAQALADQLKLTILGNSALEGADAGAARYTVRARNSNYTQIFSATVQVSGSEAAVRQIGVEDELDYQKANRLRELLRDLENTAINGVAPAATLEGSGTVRRTMRGILHSLTTNQMTPGSGLIPSDSALTEDHVNAALRTIWEASGVMPDLIVCGGSQKRKINALIQPSQRFTTSGETLKSVVSVYESDFGVCRVILSRYVPADSVIFLDSSRVAVVPLVGRSFQYLPLATTGDYTNGEVLGEYTLEVRSEKAHGVLKGLDS